MEQLQLFPSLTQFDRYTQTDEYVRYWLNRQRELFNFNTFNFFDLTGILNNHPEIGHLRLNGDGLFSFHLRNN